MSFKIENKDIYSKYSDIWNKNKKLLNVKFNSLPIYNEEYIKTKVKIFNGVIIHNLLKMKYLKKRAIMSVLLQ